MKTKHVTILPVNYTMELDIRQCSVNQLINVNSLVLAYMFSIHLFNRSLFSFSKYLLNFK